MEAYTGFAQVYDDFMDNVPYEEWCGYVCGILEEYGSVTVWCWIWAAGQAE